MLQVTREPVLDNDTEETKVFFDPETVSKWKCAADSKIEINLYRVYEDNSDWEATVDEAISLWIDGYCCFLNGCMSSDATKFLVNQIHQDSELRSLFIEKAVRSMKQSVVWHKDYTEEREEFLDELEKVEQ